MATILLIVIIGCCIWLTAVILVWKYRVAYSVHADTAIRGEELKTNLTHVRWYSEMLLKQDFGKLNFAQIEILHGINRACARAVKNFQQLSANEHVEKTLAKLEDMKKMRNNR